MWRWVGFLTLAAIFAIAFRITSEKNPPPFYRLTPCPFCEDGKIWNQAHGSTDLERVNCPHCNGTGEIDLDKIGC